MSPYTRAAACLTLLATLLVLFIPFPQSVARADGGVVMIPEGGRLEALDADGRLLGPVPLQHTAVRIDISGPFARVALRQTYRNPYHVPVEAIYTFPMSHRAAVDRMTMTVGDRVIEGEVRERNAARHLYESARQQGHVAALLEQERPNIFTQSVANIEPGATIEIDIAYIETVASRNGTSEIAFPMTVAPRYVPGSPSGPAPQWMGDAPRRQAVALLGPAEIALVDGDGALARASDDIHARLGLAIATDPPIERGDLTAFRADYADGTFEIGTFDAAGRGEIGGRWFRCPPLDAPLPELPRPVPPRPRPGVPAPAPGTPFSGPTEQVSDAHLVTPTPVRPPARAGHDISIEVTVDTGGPALVDVASALHEVVRDDEGIGRTRLTLARRSEIPNRDFVLRWRTDSEAVTESVFTHVDAADGGFVTLVIAPPARVTPDAVPPRELIFVVDSSGSMNGFPIEKSKALMERALASMRPSDSFNIITFAGATRVLWPTPRPASAENVAEAQSLLASLRSGGGTEMMSAINAALAPERGTGMTADDLANLPADGRRAEITVPMTAVHQEGDSLLIRTATGISIPLRLSMHLPTVLQPEGVTLRLAGRWNTEMGQRVFAVESAGFAEPMPLPPLRMVVFLTDGLVANEAAIIDAVRQHARTTRVFSLGIGQSVNRSLVEQVALAGRGESEIVLLADGADAAVDRLVRRLETPVLTDIEVSFDGVTVTDLVAGIPSAAPGLLPDLFEERPLILHGRYATPGDGILRVRGRTANGIWETTRSITLPKTTSESAALPALWARSTVDQFLAPHLAAQQINATPLDVRQRVVAIGERHRIVTPFTSFVAVERSRVILGGQSMTVTIPIEMAEGVQWEGIFGRGLDHLRDRVVRGAIEAQFLERAAPGGISVGLSVGDSRPMLGDIPTPFAPADRASGGGGGGGFGGGGLGRGGGAVESAAPARPYPRLQDPGPSPSRSAAPAAASEREGADVLRRRVVAVPPPPPPPGSPPPPPPALEPPTASTSGVVVGRRPVGESAMAQLEVAIKADTTRDDRLEISSRAVDIDLFWAAVQSLIDEHADGVAKRDVAPSDGLAESIESLRRLVAARQPVAEGESSAASTVPGPSIDAAIERGPLDVEMPSATIIEHSIDDVAAALVAAAGRRGVLLARDGAEASIGASVREQISLDDATPLAVGSLRAGRLAVMGDERVQLRAESALDGMRRAFDIPPRQPMARTAALAQRIDAERTDAERLEERLRRIGRRLEPSLFAAVVERLDPKGEVIDRDLLRAQLGNAVVPEPTEVILVSVLVGSSLPLGDAAARESFTAAGLRIDTTVDRMPGLVGEIGVDRLADLAEVPSVRRIGRADPRAAPRPVVQR